MRVNNRKCIYRIAGRCLFTNRRRNIITIAAIILTAVLFTSLFTIMLSINASYETSVQRQLGGCAHGTFKRVTEEQAEKLIRHKLIKAYGERIVLGLIADDTFQNQSAEISFMDDNTAKWSYIELEEGHMPAARNEVVMDTEALRLLGYKPVIGEKIDLTFSINYSSYEESKYTDTFILAGYWSFDSLSPAHFINVSREYAKDFSSEVLDLDVMLSSTFNAWNKMLKVVEESGYEYGEKTSDTSISFGVNPGYTSISMDGGDLLESIIPMGLFLILVMLTGYLIIYNVFQISVVTDIKFYGLLKTIGTTQKQLRRIIRTQAVVLCLVGIPVGLILGYFLGSKLTPAVLSTTNIGGKSLTVSTSPLVFIASAFFEVITVLLSVSKPGRMAGKVSPIEALRFNDAEISGKKEKATRGARVSQMAVANVERNRKKTAVVFASLALSLVVLNAVNMLVGGFDSEKWLSSSMSTDFVVGKTPYFKFNGSGQSPLSEKDISPVLEDVPVAEGGMAYDVTGIPLLKVNQKGRNNGIENYGTGSGTDYINCFIEGMDDYLIDKLEVCEGDVSLLKDNGKRYLAVITHKDENGYYALDENAPNIGDKITIAHARSMTSVDTRTGETATQDTFDHPEYLSETFNDMTEHEYTVCAYVDVPTDISQRRSTMLYDVIVGAEKLKADMGEDAVPLFYAFDTETASDEEKTEEYLKTFCKANPGIMYESKAVLRAEFETLKKMFTLLGGLLCIIIGFVGLLNFFNTIMAGIIARKNELAVLQAIGMTGKQVKTMLVTEGLVYSVGAGLIALVLSLIFIPIVNAAADNVFWFYSQHFSVTPVLLTIPFMALIGICVPLASYKGISRASIVERIREIG
ncbi:MAG: FtsX-like permease family protein [Treponema sp.]|nr:FtsX-like permease family protein [Treponema sp.]